jgi:hypothetical protein
MDDPNCPPVTLDYASPTPPVRRQIRTRSRFIGAARQVTFAFGLGLLLYGLGRSVNHDTDGPGEMGFGGVLIGVAWKFRRGDRL